MKLVSKEDWVEEDWVEFNKTAYEKKTVKISDFHYKTNFYDDKGNLAGFYESFPDKTGNLVCVYFIV